MKQKRTTLAFIGLAIISVISLIALAYLAVSFVSMRTSLEATGTSVAQVATTLPSATVPPMATATEQIAVATPLPPTATPTTAPEAPPVEKTPEEPPVRACPFSVMLRADTINLLTRYQPEIIVASDANLAVKHFGDLPNSTRVLVGASLAELQTMMAQLDAAGVPYEGVAYDLEGWEQTPEAEKQDPVGATAQAAALAHGAGKILVMVPGLKFMDKNPQAYAGMAANADAWVIQSQRRQGMYPAGADYRAAILEVINQVRAGNPNVPIWVQLSVTPGQGNALSVDDLLAYRNAIIDDVVGINIFDLLDPTKPTTLEGILAAVCP